MRVILIDNPAQSENTVSPQIIDGEVFHWIVRSERLKINETFKEWLVRIEEKIKTRPHYSNVEAILLYNIQPVVTIPSSEGITYSGMIISYAFLNKKDKNV